MTRYIEVTMIFELGNGSTLELRELKEAVEYSVHEFVPQPTASSVHVKEVIFKDTEDEDEQETTV